MCKANMVFFIFCFVLGFVFVLFLQISAMGSPLYRMSLMLLYCIITHDQYIYLGVCFVTDKLVSLCKHFFTCAGLGKTSRLELWLNSLKQLKIYNVSPK